MIEISRLNVGSFLERRGDAVSARRSSCENHGAEFYPQHQTSPMGLGFEDHSTSQKVRWRISLGETHWLFGPNKNSTLEWTLSVLFWFAVCRLKTIPYRVRGEVHAGARSPSSEQGRGLGRRWQWVEPGCGWGWGGVWVLRGRGRTPAGRGRWKLARLGRAEQVSSIPQSPT